MSMQIGPGFAAVGKAFFPWKLIDVGKPTKDDFVAGLTVAIVALPLAIAFGLASGATAASGLYAAIFGGFFAALLGSSKVNISGPTGAMTVVLVEITQKHGLQGMVLAGIMAGIMQIALGYVKAGRLVKFLPHCLIAGFTSGIAVVIFRGQLPSFSGAPAVGLATILTMIAVGRFWRNGPGALLGLLAGVATNLVAGGPTVQGVPQTLPAAQLPITDLATLSSAFSAAVTICILGSIEGLLSATVADSTLGTRHNSNKELIGQGIGNLMSALFGGVPITGAVARTGVAVRSGAKTAWTGMIHSLILLLVVLVFAPFSKYIPLASLAGILMVTSFRMVEWESLKLIPKAPRHYTSVLVTTMALTIFTDLTFAVGVGFTLATLLFTLRLTRHPFESPNITLSENTAEFVSVQTLNGPLFFGVTQTILETLEQTGKHILVLDMRKVPLVDATGALMLQKLDHTLRQQGGGLIVYGLDERAEETLHRLDERDVPKYAVVKPADEVDLAISRSIASLPVT